MAATNVVGTIAEQLTAAGITRIYGLPGGEMLDILEATRQAGIRFVLTHHEAAAAFMAAAEGRYRRSLAACISTLGPGATNLVSGIAHAYLDRCPVIAITAELPATLGADYTHQHLDLPRLFAPITKGTFTLSTENVRTLLAEAVALATTEPFGPISLHVPRDVALQACKEPVGQQPGASAAAVKGDLSLDDISARLNAARRPLVVVGLGTPPDVAPVLRRFVDAYGAPAGVTPKVKGLIDEGHPLFTGTYGGMMADSVLIDFIGERDLVLCIGLDPSEIDREWPAREKQIWFLSSRNVDQAHLPPHSWCGDLQMGLERLTAALTTPELDGRRDAARVRQAIRAKLESGIPAPAKGLSPLRVLESLAETWPVTDAVCCDVGAHKLLLGQAWPSSVPNRFFMSNGLSSMGYGVAAPIALSLTANNAPVLSIIGDGGLLMYMGELETAVREGARVLYVAFCDNALALIESSQRRRHYPLYGMRFAVPDVVQVAKAFGLSARYATTIAELGEAVANFSEQDGPALVGVPIDTREYDAQVS